MELSENLKKAVLETANAGLNISINSSGNYYVVIGDKHRLENPELEGLCSEIYQFILDNREEKESTKRSPKPFTL